MTVLERWHVGPWTTRGTLPGEPLEPGRKRTPDELNFDVVGLARILGRRLDGRAELQVRLWQNELRPTHTRLCGVHTLADPDNSRQLADTARDAFIWLAERAPAGYEFVLTDAIYLRPRTDLNADVVAVETVIQLATERDGNPPPTAHLATSHVRRSAAGMWFAGDAVSNWSGPHPSPDEAAAAVQTARTALAQHLRASGHHDLAATETRWPPVSRSPRQ
ncbi:hypothetical protein EV643_102140 [Kribbella sp. VKM Ac-2527]|uniref:Uncharacterized protein n=1 Tax=Kribbella caucasensis TaxID=2512215 RepID=A0A4R6KLQ1_9ACTN|nr:hypothetical protein [Kribbella sp. VKM Ac-2527]TDO52303.1 hypothetical protein EV643_102140 [Kribbella sp. VKM Ac-2527]